MTIKELEKQIELSHERENFAFSQIEFMQNVIWEEKNLRDKIDYEIQKIEMGEA